MIFNRSRLQVFLSKLQESPYITYDIYPYDGEVRVYMTMQVSSGGMSYGISASVYLIEYSLDGEFFYLPADMTIECYSPDGSWITDYVMDDLSSDDVLSPSKIDEALNMAQAKATEIWRLDHEEGK